MKDYIRDERKNKEHLPIPHKKLEERMKEGMY